MKIKLLFLIAFFLLLEVHSQCTTGDVYIPDANFKAALVANPDLNLNGDAEISCDEAAAFTNILFVNNNSISDLTGIEAFVNLTSLNCSSNLLTSLDLSNNKALRSLICSNNSLSSLDLFYNTSLNSLNCSNNSLVGLYIFNNKDLNFLNFDRNSLTSLDLSNNTSLTRLLASYNSLVSLDLSGHYSLNDISCYDNKLTSLILPEGSTNLTSISCGKNQLDNINVSSFSSLEHLSCLDNQITSIDVANNKVLTSLYCSDNLLTSLNVANGNNNNFTELLATNNSGLVCVQVDDVTYSEDNWLDKIDETARFSERCGNVYIPDANFKAALVNDTSINYDGDGEISFEEAAVVWGISVSNKSISDLTGIEEFTEIRALDCSGNSIKELNLYSNKELDNLHCQNNEIAGLILPSYGSLNYLDCSNNFLVDLDVSSYTFLEELNCSNNKLESLNVVSNTNHLKKLYCFNNFLTSINLPESSTLNYFYCSNNSLTSLSLKSLTSLYWFEALNNPDLSCIDVSNVPYSNANWGSDIDEGVIFSENCSVAECYVTIPDANFKAILIGNPDINIDGGTEISCHEASLYSGTIYVYNQSIADLTGIEAFTNITTLYCSNNSLTNLDLSENIALENLYCANNQITNLDISSNSELGTLDVSNNALTSLNIANGNNQYDSDNYYFSGNLNLTCIQVDNKTLADNAPYWSKDSIARYSEDCSLACYVEIPDQNLKAYLLNNNAINTDDDGEISCDEALAFTGYIEVNSLSITDLTGVEAFVNATALFCAYNNLTSIDVTKNTELLQLFCNGNSLTTLDISKNTKLENLGVHENELTSIDVSSHSALKILYAHDNLLTGLNAANGNNYSFTNFSAYNNASLTCIQVDDKAYSDDVWFNDKDAIASYSEDCNQDTTCYLNIPDANFKANLVGNTVINTNGDTEISCDEAASFTGSIFCQYQEISDLTGIEAFTEITVLYCNNNQLTNLDIDANKKLVTLNCSDNNLNSLNLSKNLELEQLWIDGNTLPELNVTGNIDLEDLDCSGNQITNLDLSYNVALDYVACGNNNLTILNLKNGNNYNLLGDSYFTGNPNLTCIEVDDKAYFDENWSSAKDATASYSEDCNYDTTCYVNIPDVNFKAYLVDNSAINTNGDTEISCDEASNYSGSLNVGGKAISDLTGIEAFVNINDLRCFSNDLTSLDLSSNPLLTYIDCSYNEIQSLNVSENTLLQTLDCSNNALESINISENIALTSLEIGKNELNSLVISSNVNLDYLNCNDNNLESLDVASNILLESLALSNNKITSLNVSKNTRLLSLYFRNNLIEEIDVSANTLLETLSCHTNNIKNIDITKNTMLTSLVCRDNLLTMLNVANGNNYNFTNFNTTNNPNLTCIQVDDKAYSDDVWFDAKDETASYSEDCNYDTTCYVNIPDVNFKSYLLSNTEINTNDDGEISCKEASEYVWNINVSDLNISDLTGIEAFINIIGLSCSNNNISSLDVSKNLSLENLYCSNNSLKSLDVAYNNQLLWLDCTYNELMYLNTATDPTTGISSILYVLHATNNPNLTCVQVDASRIEEFRVSGDFQIDDTASYSTDCTVTASINDAELAEFTVYPNPVSKNLHIKLYEAIEKASIFNLQGEKLLETTEQEIKVSQFSSGIYLLKVFSTSGKVGVRRFIKE